jgi:hypothetical protein
VILHCNYEELTALNAGARVLLDREEADSERARLSPRLRADVENLLRLLDGDLSLSTLDEVLSVERAVIAIVRHMRVEMETEVVVTHPAEEGAVAAYFDFAHGFVVEHRVREMAAEMEALIELVTGEDPTREAVGSFDFTD